MRRLLLLSSLIAAVGVAPQAVAWQNAGTPSQWPDSNLRDPATMSALDRMGASLRTRTNVSVRVDITAEDVLLNGQKLQYGGTLDVAAARPNKLRMMLSMGPSGRQLYYDGKSLTVYSPQPNLYAVFDAPPTIKETLKVAAEQYGVEIPLADMFAWGEEPELATRVIEAFPAGEENIGGVLCEHHAVRQELVDWQIWLRKDESALPCKLVITSTADPAMPQYTGTYKWLDNVSLDPASFDFKAPQGAQKINFQRPDGGAAETAGR